MIKEQLQALANKTKIAQEFREKAKKILKLKKFDRQQCFYLCKKLGIKTNFRRGRPERKFD